MPLLVRLELYQDCYRLRTNGSDWPAIDGIIDEITDGMQEITESDLPKPLCDPLQPSVRLFKKQHQEETEYLALYAEDMRA